MRKKGLEKLKLNLYMKYRINRSAEEYQSRKSATRNRIFSRLCSALLCSALLCSDIMALSFVKCHLSL